MSSSKGLKLARRYFSKSVSKYQRNNPKPEKFFWKYPDLLCQYCGKNLLKPRKSGIVVIWQIMDDYRKDQNISEVEDIYCCCKGNCDEVLNKRFSEKYKHAVDGWEDIPDICIPTIYLKWINSIFQDLRGRAKYTEEAFKKIERIMSAVFPYISRELTSEDKNTIKDLTEIPSYLGGLGY